MRKLLRRTEIALSLDRPLTVQAPPVQIRDKKHQLILTVSAEIHATYRVINSKSFAHHYADFASFEAVFCERMKVAASSALSDALSGKDRSCFAKESIKIGQQITELLKPFLAEAGAVIFNCSCNPVVSESCRLDDLEYIINYLQELNDIAPGLAVGAFLSQAGAGAMSGMNPVMNALWGKAINPTPQKPDHKNNSLI